MGNRKDWCGITFGDKESNSMYYAENLYIHGELVADVIIFSGFININDYAFYDGDSLTSVTIPDSVTTIQAYAFFHCDDLKNVYYSGTKKQWEQIKIGDDNARLTSATIHYKS